MMNDQQIHTQSNNQWKSSNPKKIFDQDKITWDTHSEILKTLFIDENCFKLLSDPYPGDLGNVVKFWEARAALIATELDEVKKVKLSV